MKICPNTPKSLDDERPSSEAEEDVEAGASTPVGSEADPSSSSTAAQSSEPDTSPSPTMFDKVIIHFSDTSDTSSSDAGLFCHPKPLPTPLGIPRLFVVSTYRHRGIALALLNCAARTFIHGCPLDPKKGQVAFSQPSRAGRAVMERWGGGAVRIYEE